MTRCLPVCQVYNYTYTVWVRGPAEGFPLSTGLFTGLGRLCIPVSVTVDYMDCVYVGVCIWREM